MTPEQQKQFEDLYGVSPQANGFLVGALVVREMMARFVEQGGDPVTATSIRLNWNPTWLLADPGGISSEFYEWMMTRPIVQ